MTKNYNLNKFRNFGVFFIEKPLIISEKEKVRNLCLLPSRSGSFYYCQEENMSGELVAQYTKQEGGKAKDINNPL